ncbi:MAG: hypothetical protein A2W90_05555 [Bacteroidetes bacterium GWF2_42_66]|nr:MAG: hypothetical protein A2W92_00935 [Bacteroidetes bacterium GWA2_42_15]OFX96129.1 MAG: hypothetical protein A2W89_21270 [Bacteroidetes bacterium GWE2_42_39]OFY45185.1 MAG: hypothetical protein A2W90_05555 [Bacteroidetes bacterium GWF2_42_66]
MKWASENADTNPILVNGHFHTPFSFSAFTEIEQAFTMAQDEGVQVLGINDFYTTDGYEEFTGLARKYKIFPLYNIEFMALQKDEQANNIRVNDPNNPGRTYFSGKGLSFPFKLNEKYQALLEQVQEESNIQTAEMIDKLNALLSELEIGIQFTAEDMKARYARNMLRERHIAKALREAVHEKFDGDENRKSVLTKIFSGKEPKSNLDDFAGLENEIRGNLLKAGGKAFVPENDRAFLSLEEVRDLIINGGGIPCYPVLLDNPKGEFTDYEGDSEALFAKLQAKNISSLELIPGRNKFSILKDFVNFFYNKGFVITFGTEHNTPALEPVKVSCSGGVDLDEELVEIGYEGACIIAAHQYLIAKGKPGYLDENGKAKTEQNAEFVVLGNAIIKYFNS